MPTVNQGRTGMTETQQRSARISHFIPYFVTFVLNSKSRHAAAPHHLRCWCIHKTGLIRGFIRNYELWSKRETLQGLLTCSPVTLCPGGWKMCSVIPLKCRYRRLCLPGPDHAVEFLPVAFTTGAGCVAPHCACAENGPYPFKYSDNIML